MSIETIKIPYNEGRVCYLTDSSSGYKATVECYEIKKAFRFSYDKKHRVNIGDWVKFRGSIRVNTRTGKTGWPEADEYYHAPYDESPKENWTFYEMEDGAEAQIIAPPDISHRLKEAMIHMRRHMDSWTANSGSSSLKQTIDSLNAAADSLRHILQKQITLEKDRNEPIKTIDITI